MKILNIDCSGLSDEQLIIIDDKLAESSHSNGEDLNGFIIETDFDVKKINILKINGDAKSFGDYLVPGKLIKNFFVNEFSFSAESALKIFSLSEMKVEEQKTVKLKELEIIPPDDPKLLEALGKLEKIKRNKKTGLN